MTQREENVSSVTVAPPRGEGRAAITGGCIAVLSSTLLTGGLLFVNGSLVLAVLNLFTGTTMQWINKNGIGQFLLFAVPVAMVVAQWLMIDYVRTRFSHHRH